MNYTPLKRLVKISSGAGFPLEFQGLVSEQLPFFKVGSLSSVDYRGVLCQPDNTISTHTAGRLGAEVIPENSSLMAKIGAATMLGRVGQNPRACCIDNNLMALTPRNGSHPRFIYYLLQTIDLYPLMNPGAVPNLNLSAFRHLDVPSPEPMRQRAVADYLDHETAEIDALISDLEKLNVLTREHTRAKIVHLMTRGARQGGYRKTQLGHVIRITQGQVDPRLAKFASWPLIAPNHIESRSGRLLEVESAEEQGAESGKYIVKPGQILYSKIRPALMKAIRLDFPALCSADMYPIDANPRWLSNDYLLEYLLAPEFESFAVTTSERVAMPKLNRETLSRAPIVLPELTVQGKIVSAVREVREKHLGLQTEASKAVFLARERRAALISAAVTGQIDVTQRRRPVAEQLEEEVLQKV